MINAKRLFGSWSYGSALVGLAAFAPAVALAADPPPPPVAAPAPAPVPPPAAPGAAAPAPVPAPAPAPAVIAPAAPPATPAPPIVEAAPPLPPPAPLPLAPMPPPPDDKFKKINTGVWINMGVRAQNKKDPKKLDKANIDNSAIELHFSGQVKEWLSWTANAVGGFANDRDGSGGIALLDAIAQIEVDPAFHLWFGRMLVPSDRANFSGVWFAAPWYYPGTYAFPTLGYIGPMQGPNGRNDGVTLWGQFADGLFKYYAGVYGLQTQTYNPFLSGRLNLSLINPEPGYYSNSTYYGSKDVLALAVGGQFQKRGWAGATGSAALPGNGPSVVSDYSEFNADLLFEKNLAGAGTVDVEGAVYAYGGDTKTLDTAFLGVASFLVPTVTGVGKLQPLVRVQHATPKTGDAATSIEAQLGYVVDDFNAKFALGFQHTDLGSSKTGNALYVGVQLKE